MLYILDIAFYGAAFKDIRKYIVENMYINSITTDIKAFKGVNSGQLIVDVTNIKKYNSNIDIINYNNLDTVNINQYLWDNENNEYKYYTPLDIIASSINNKLKSYSTLGEVFPKKYIRTCCALTGKTDDFIVNNRAITLNSKDIFPYIEGSKGLSGKFCKPTYGRYIRYDYDLQIKLSNEFKKELEVLGVKNKKRVTLGDKEAYLAPKLFIRQSAYELIVTYTDEPIAANNSIYVLTTKEYDTDSINRLKYTCGVLNSDLITFYCHINKIIRVEKGKIPQIKLSDLKNINLKLDTKYYSNIVNIVDKLLVDSNNKNLLGDLNKIVYNIYGINTSEINYINSYLKDKIKKERN